MKFKCGPTEEEYHAKWKAMEEKRKKKFEWHTWYAWYPVSVRMGECRWLETVQRRRKYYAGEYSCHGWVYCDMEDTSDDV